LQCCARPDESDSQRDDAVALGENVVDLKPEAAAGQRNEVLEKSPHLCVSAVVARERRAPWDMPEDVIGEGPRTRFDYRHS
jgi:hypothetical protein